MVPALYFVGETKAPVQKQSVPPRERGNQNRQQTKQRVEQGTTDSSQQQPEPNRAPPQKPVDPNHQQINKQQIKQEAVQPSQTEQGTTTPDQVQREPKPKLRAPDQSMPQNTEKSQQ